MSIPAPLTDIGPATPPPPWYPAGTAPSVDSINDEGTLLWSWVREVGKHVWIACEDHAIDGRVMRSQPKIELGEVELGSVEEAHALAEELLEAENILAAAVEGSQP